MRVTFFSALVIFALLFSLGLSANGQASRTSISVKIHSERSAPGGLKIKFVELIEDSRCPADTGVQCIWAGNAKVKIEVRTGKGKSQTFELNSTTQPTVVRFSGYDIGLRDLTPHPRSNIRISGNGYVATFSVKKS